MPLTKQIIQEVVKEEVTNNLSRIESKLDRLTDLVTNFAGRLSVLETDHEVLSGQVANRTDRIEKLETHVFGSIQA